MGVRREKHKDVVECGVVVVNWDIWSNSNATSTSSCGGVSSFAWQAALGLELLCELAPPPRAVAVPGSIPFRIAQVTWYFLRSAFVGFHTTQVPTPRFFA
jgi:hypothetical protein